MAGRLDTANLNGATFTRVGDGMAVSVNGSRAPVSPWPTTMARTRRALHAFVPDVVHVHEPLVPGPSAAALLSHRWPLVGTFHRSGADLAYRSYGHLAGRWARRLDAVFAVSEEAAITAEACVGHLRERVAIIPNGVEVSRLANVEPWPSKGPTVVFVGRHERRKGLAVLLEAFAQLPETARLWALGDGPDSKGLRARFASDKRVEWPGAVDDAERARRLAGADVFAAPSLGGESFGVVLLEAMAAGTAVVASDLPGYRLAALQAAKFVSPGEPAALAQGLLGVLYDEDERRSLCKKGLERAAECDVALVAAQYREVYGRLAGPGRE